MLFWKDARLLTIVEHRFSYFTCIYSQKSYHWRKKTYKLVDSASCGWFTSFFYWQSSCEVAGWFLDDFKFRESDILISRNYDSFNLGWLLKSFPLQNGHLQKLWPGNFGDTFEELLTANEEYSDQIQQIYTKERIFLRKYLLLCQWCFWRCDKFSEKSSWWYEKKVFSKKT